MIESATRNSTNVRRIAFIAGAVFAVTYIVALMTTKTAVSTAVKMAVSLVAMAGFIGFVVAELHLIRRLDELERRIQCEAFAFAFPVSVGLLMLLGLFQRFMTLPVDDLSYRHLWPLMILAYVAGLALARWRYQ